MRNCFLHVYILTQAEKLCVHPLYLMLPATVSASFAFMLPVATPPNTIAFTYGYLKVYDMVRHTYSAQYKLL